MTTTRCLVVDDDAEIRTLLSAYLRQHGMEVEALARGTALRQRLPLGGADVLVLDVMLPDDDGLALCQWSKRKAPALPVIMLTAQGDPVSRVRPGRARRRPADPGQPCRRRSERPPVAAAGGAATGRREAP